MAGTGAEAGSAVRYEDVACPFCGMLCDDLEVENSGGRLTVLKNGCPKAKSGFGRAVAGAVPRIAGKDATLADAVAAVTAQLRTAKLPFFGGLATDVNGMRAAMALAEKAGGVIDHATSESYNRNTRVLQNSGWVMTTLTEARNRADLFVILGTNVNAVNPRFLERIVLADRSMFSDAPPKRTIVFVGDGLDASVASGGRVGDVLSLPVKPDRIGELLDAMRALGKGAPVSGDTIAGVPRGLVEDLLARCKAASYGVMVWAPQDLKFANADLTVQAISEFIKDLNLITRFAGLSIGGSEGSTTAGAVCAWQSGYPLRVSYASGKPIYDSTNNAGTKLIADRATDLIVWIASFSPDVVPPESDIPLIVVGTPGLKLAREPDIYIPVGTPGADHAGLLVRADSAVTLPVRNLGRSSLPAAADVLNAIEAAL